MPIRVRDVAVVLSIALAFPAASRLAFGSAMDQDVSRTSIAIRMSDGKQWTTANLNVATRASYCYDDAEVNCRRYGRLYTWDAARQGCQSLGHEWRLPTDGEWREMAKHYGGVRDDSADTGKSAYMALSIGGGSGFNAVLGGDRSADGRYERLQAHGFYWTASASDRATAWFYNFGKGGLSLNRHRDGDTRMALSVRCVGD